MLNITSTELVLFETFPPFCTSIYQMYDFTQEGVNMILLMIENVFLWYFIAACFSYT